jgi:hypothetical protein
MDGKIEKVREEILAKFIERYPEFNTKSMAFVMNMLAELEVALINDIKAEMYKMPDRKIEYTDGKSTEVLPVLTKYQVASLLNCYRHTYFDGTTDA